MKVKNLLTLLLLVIVSTDTMAYIAKPTNLTPTIKWEITDDGVLRIYGTGDIPDFKVGKRKHWQSKKYFSDKIKRIEIGEGITSIGSWAFYIGGYYDSDHMNGQLISLPSTLTKIGAYGLYGLIVENDGRVVENPKLPDGLTSVDFNGLIVPKGKLTVPKNVERLSLFSFRRMGLQEITIEGSPKLDYSTFHSLGNKGEVKVIFKDPSIDLSPIARDPQYSWDDGINEVFNVTFVVPALTNVPKKFDDLTAHYKIIIEEDPKIVEADSNVNSYIASRLEPWANYISKKKMPALVTEYNAKAGIKFSMEQWQKKGEYETTKEWEKRVNEKTRKEMLSKLTDEWNKKANDAIEAYNKTALEYKKEYEDKREALRKEFYVTLVKKAMREYIDDVYTLTSSYDADNQSFMINTKNHGDILLKVPRSEASGFKQNWSRIVKNIDFAFLPASETSVGLSRIIFPYNGKEYSYDGKTQTAYKVEDPNYAFTPLEVTGLKIDDLAVADIPAPESQGKVLTQQNPTEAQKEKPMLSDVDQDIPTGTIKRDKTFAFIIANENYTRTDPVTFALNDGESMKKYCEKTLGIPTSNITYVKDATLNDMRFQLKRISDICSAFGDEASVLVYYAGHGVPEEGSSDAYLLPVDGYAENVKTGLSLKEMVDALGGLPASNVTLLLDACFSGTGREGNSLYASRGVAMRPKSVVPKGNLVLFSASQGVESALPYKSKGHGLFTYYLLKKLKETRGQVSLGELTEYVTDNVKRTSVVEGKIQTPTVSASVEKTDWREIKL